MDKYSGLFGIVAILGGVYFASNNRGSINWRLVLSGLSLQIFLAVFILQTPWGKGLFQFLGQAVERLLNFADLGVAFVLGPLANSEVMVEVFGASGAFVFAFKLIPAIIFVAALSSIAYHFGIMQKVVRAIALIIYRVMGASGAEATSNVGSVLIGPIEAQLLIRPFLSKATQSELLAIMTGSLACIAGAVLVVYVNMGIAAEFLIAASVMAIPGALVIAKLLYPEVEDSITKGDVKVAVERKSINALDALSEGAVDGLKVGAAACAVIIAMLSVIAALDYGVGHLGLFLAELFYDSADDATLLGLDLNSLTLGKLLGTLFSVFAIAMGVSLNDSAAVGELLGIKLVANELVSYSILGPMIAEDVLEQKSVVIATFALCGFANLGSTALLIGGISRLVPERKHDLARLGLRAMVCGTLASYMSASIAGILFSSPAATEDQSLIVPFMIMIAALVLIVGLRCREKALMNRATKTS